MLNSLIQYITVFSISVLVTIKILSESRLITLHLKFEM